MIQGNQKYHRLLRRQLRNFSSDLSAKPDDWEKFISLVNETYIQVDRERRFLENALDVTAKELTGVNGQLQLFIENAPIGIAMLDNKFRYLYTSRRWLEDRRLEKVDVIGKSHHEIHPDMRDDWKEIHKKCLLGESASCEEDKIILPDGGLAWIRWEVRPWINFDKSIGGLIIFSEDITQRKVAEEELRIASVAFQSRDSMVVTDSHGNILRINEAFQKTSGYSAEDLVGKSILIFKSFAHHDEAYYRNIWEAITSEGRWEGSIWTRTKEGRVKPNWLSISAVRNPQGLITHFIGIYSSTSDPREAERKIMELAYYDPLTHLPNRRLLLDRLNQARMAAARNKSFGAVLLIDIDNFKSVNDTSGHDVGDQALIAVAQSLRNNLREMDTAARLGGDEFIVLITDLGQDADHAMYALKIIVDKLHSTISKPIFLRNNSFTVTASIGVALFSHETKGLNELLKEADLALYEAKGVGRNSVRFFDEVMHTEFAKKINIETTLRQAIDRDELSLVLQPQVNEVGQIIGAEALLRWTASNGDVISPEIFIPIAEESGLIIPIGQWVLQAACSQLLSWSCDEICSQFSLAVNISAKQFRQSNFVVALNELISKSGINPGLLKLELTESLLLDDIDSVIATMKDLRKIGVRFSIDDFGTGYSSLNYLKRLPLDEIKIDRSFVVDVVSNEGDQAIIRSILSLAKSLKLRVIAEGIETVEQKQYLFSEGCYFYQGFLFGKPLSPEDFRLLAHSIH